MQSYINSIRFVVGVVLLTIVSAVSVQAIDIYRCKDDAGHTIFQDLPCEGGDTSIISWSGSKSAAPGISSNNAAIPAAFSSAENTPARESAPEAAVVGKKHFFWRATKVNHGVLYLFGSVHFGRAEMYPLPKVVLDAFAQSDALVVEVNALNMDPMVLAQSFAARGIYVDGGSLREDVDTATWQRLGRLARELGLSVEMMNMQKPWMAAMTLGAMSVKRAGFSESLGIDMHFLKQAKDKMTIVELESMAFQAELLSSLPLDSQRVMLADTLRILDEGPSYYQRMLDAWQNGKVAALEGVMSESLSGSTAAEHLNKVMLEDRNVAMVAKLTALSVGRQRHFVVVGAAHLVGPRGLVEMLRHQGYVVEQF